MTTAQRNNVHVSGHGPVTMVFAHGFGCDQSMWRSLAPEFGLRYRTVLYDLVGSGMSDLSAYDRNKYASLQGHADDLIEILREFADGPVVFVGHSVSAMIGMLADIKSPGLFARQVMISPTPSFISDGDYVGPFEAGDIDGLLETMEGNYLGWSSTTAPTIMGAPSQPELSVELTNSFCRTDPDIARHFARVTFMSDARGALPQLKTPTLIVQCDDDLLAPLSVGDYMHSHIGGSMLRVIPNVGHCPHLSAPSACTAAMNEFLAELS